MNDLKTTPTSQINGTTTAMNYSPDLSTTTHTLQYMRAFYTPRASVDVGALQGAAQVQANASITDTNGYEYCVINDETSAGVTNRGGVYLGKVSDFVSYFVAKSFLTTSNSTTTTCEAAYCPLASGTANCASITANGAGIGVIKGQLVALGLLTVANGVYSVVSSVSTISTNMESDLK